MRIVLLIAFCISVLYCNSQKKYDSLKKYSYFIYGIVNDNRWSEATGFFIKKKNKLFLISALHVFSGRNIDHTMEMGYPNILYLRIKNHSVTPTYFPINISKIKDTVRDADFYINPDVFVYEIKLLKAIKIYSIEKFIKPVPCDKAVNVITCGYPIDQKASKKETLVASPVLIHERVIGNYCKPIYWTDHKVNDNINYLISANNGIRDGSSGSPVYFIIQDKIYFAGLISVGTNENAASVVRPQNVLSKIH